MSDDSKSVHQQLMRGHERTRGDRILDAATNWRNWVVVVIVAGLILDHFGVITVPRIGDVHKLVVLGVIGGYIGGKFAVWPVVQSRIQGDTVSIAITPVEGKIMDIIEVPKNTFWKWDVFGGDLVERYSLTGDIRFSARGIDLARGLLVPAGDRPEDDEVPDDIELIGSGADERYHKLRGRMLDEFRLGTERARDEQVMIEEAKREVSNEFAELFESIRAGNIDVHDLDETEADKRADEIVRNLAMKAGEGEGDE